MNSTYIQLKQNLEYLKMKQMLLHLDEVLDFITANNLSFTEGLVKLTSHEIDFKEARAGEYSTDFEGMIKLNEFINLETGEHIRKDYEDNDLKNFK